MAKKYVHFIPRGDADRGVWSVGLGEKVVTYGPQLGLTPAQVTRVQELTGLVREKTDKANIKFLEYQEAVSAKNLLVTNELAELAKIAGIMKRHPDYTENIGKELGIIGSSTTVDTNYVKPVLKAESFPGFVAITFNKQMQSRVCIYGRVKGSTGWDLLARPSTSPYKDRRSLPEGTVAETREYMAVCWDGDEEFGQQSDIVYTLFGG